MPGWEFPLSPEFTGERVVPGLVDVNLLNEHLSRYGFAKRFAPGKRVLDAGCGSGYGAAELAETALEVTGIDAAADAVEYARGQYRSANLRFEQGLCTALPDGPYDLITAFEVIEHLEDWRGFLAEARRVLAPEGRFVVSTPNKLYYAESRGGSGANPFHVHEFEYVEFQEELQRVFPHVAIFTQNHVEGVIFAPLAGGGGAEASVPESRAVPEEAHFFVAVCGAEPLPEIGPLVWVPSVANVLRERERHIELLAGEIRMKTEWLEQRKSELDIRNSEFEQLLGTVRGLNSQIEQRNLWALEAQAEADRLGRLVLDRQEEFERESASFRETVRAYQSKVAELEEINRAKTEWALETERRLTDTSRDLAECVEFLHAVEKTVEERTAWAQGLDRELAQWQRRFDALRGSRWVRLAAKLKIVDPL
ncbi:MAG: Methyltransferase type 11 [Bryobacterales bacterium]|nr:Methyltransferase type 11 [Bryobacterales bacterium]